MNELIEEIIETSAKEMSLFSMPDKVMILSWGRYTCNVRDQGQCSVRKH